jgi:hypothetical protein
MIIMQSVACSNRLLLIDTGNNDAAIYRTFLTLAEHVGFSTTYKKSYDADLKTLSTYDSIIIALDGGFFSTIASQLSSNHTILSTYVKHILETIYTVSTFRNKLIGIILPNANNSVMVLNLTIDLLNRLDAIDPAHKHSIMQLLQPALQHLLFSDASKSYRYNTALLPKREPHKTIITEAPEEKNSLPKSASSQSVILATALPRTSTMTDSHPLSPLLPLGMYMFNAQTENEFFITRASYITATDIREAFMLNPVDVSLRKHYIHLLATTLKELRDGIQNGPPGAITSLPSTLCTSLTDRPKPYNSFLPTYAWTQKGIACGWLGIEQYQTYESVDRLVQLGLNILWFELNPEWYLNDNGMRLEKKELFLHQVKTFTHLLKKVCSEKKIMPPHFFVGTDITSNFAQKAVPNPASDIYGTVYSKIPSPLDWKTLWKDELLTGCDRFIDAWNNSIGNGLPLSGVFLDLEMYHAQHQAGQFESLMDFSDYAWRRYLDKTGQKSIMDITHEVDDRVKFLLQSKQMEHYFTFLQTESRQLGKSVKEHLNKKLPQGVIGVYNIHLPHTWFYQGFLSGLSTPSEPIVCATFNNDFYSHQHTLEALGIYALHLPVVLLSKIKHKNDAAYIKALWDCNHGVWFNRVSRLEESRNPKDWGWDWGVETTPLSTAACTKIINETLAECSVKK